MLKNNDNDDEDTMHPHSQLIWNYERRIIQTSSMLKFYVSSNLIWGCGKMT